MAEVIWSPEAIECLAMIRTYIGQFDPDAATRIAADLVAASDGLETFPNRGRPADNGRRELAIVPPYVIRYKVVGDRVTITGIKHGRQNV